jgi:3-methylcrotonyl-CoA carboxylase alpha subunit
LPATGRLDYLALPDHLARIDAGIRQGDEITPFYDPMIAKLIVHGPSRKEALGRLSQALSRTRVAGAVTNVGFLERLAALPDFVLGEVDTGLIDRHLDRLIDQTPPSAAAWGFAALSALDLLTAKAVEQETAFDPWSGRQGWRLWGTASQVATLARGDEVVEIEITFKGRGAYQVVTPAGRIDLERVHVDGVDVVANVDGVKVSAGAVRYGNTVTIFIDGQTLEWTVAEAVSDNAADPAGGDHIRAPMPGLIKLVHVRDGDGVTRNMPLLVMEAMKMEHTLKAPRDGIVEHCLVDVGDQVEEGALLMQMLADPAAKAP